VNNAVLMEMENLRRASMADLRKKYQEVFHEQTRCCHREHLFRRIVWRLQALAEGDLSERAAGGRIRSRRMATCESMLREVSLRWAASRFRRQEIRIDGNQIALPLPGALLTRKWKGGRFWWRCSRRDSGMRTDTIPRSARLRLRLPALAGTAWPSSGLRAPRAGSVRSKPVRKSNQGAKGEAPSPARLRCAIYTRKSTEEGLEQEFNSLDAQREAAEAFIQSQRREGWIALPSSMMMAASPARTWTAGSEEVAPGGRSA